MTKLEMAAALCDIADFLAMHNRLDLALKAREAMACIENVGKSKMDLLDELYNERHRARTLNVALGKEIRREEELENQVFALQVRLYIARVRAGIDSTTALESVLREMSIPPGKKALHAYKCAYEGKEKTACE